METVTATHQRMDLGACAQAQLTDDVDNNQEKKGIFAEHPDLTDSNHDCWKNDSRDLEDYSHSSLLRWLYTKVPGPNE